MNRTIVLALFVTLSLAGCDHKGEEMLADRAGRPLEAKIADQTAAAPRLARKYLAYEHSMTLTTNDKAVVATFELAKQVCDKAIADGCVVLSSQIQSGESPWAEIKFRAKTNGIRQLLAEISKQGDVSQQSTTAEDLEAPIVDTAKNLAMLEDYRGKLEALRTRASADVDSLIKVNKELAEVQSQIEAASGKRAHLMQRADTEILNVRLQSTATTSAWRSIIRAISNFGTNIAEGTANAITAVAYLLPWVVALLLGGWGARTLWRWTRRRANR